MAAQIKLYQGQLSWQSIWIELNQHSSDGLLLEELSILSSRDVFGREKAATGGGS